MEKETRYFIHYLFPGAFFAETISESVSAVEIPKEIPSDCYSFYLTSEEVVIDDVGKEFHGESKTASPTYVIGTIYGVEDIPPIDRGVDTDILKQNIKYNSPTKQGIKTHTGNWLALGAEMEVIHPSEITFCAPKIYKNFKKD